MYFDRFDICEAYYVYATGYHSGQNSPEYAVFGRLARMGFSPKANLSEGNLSENGWAILGALVRGEMRVRNV